MSIELVWITVSDLQSAIDFYTKEVGMELKERHEQYGWAELSGKGGARLGLAQAMPEGKPGTNAVVAITVDDLEKAKQGLEAKLVGEMQEIPGHVKLQMFQDADGNQMQLVEKLS